MDKHRIKSLLVLEKIKREWAQNMIAITPLIQMRKNISCPSLACKTVFGALYKVIAIYTRPDVRAELMKEA